MFEVNGSSDADAPIRDLQTTPTRWATAILGRGLASCRSTGSVEPPGPSPQSIQRGDAVVPPITNLEGQAIQPSVSWTSSAWKLRGELAPLAVKARN